MQTVCVLYSRRDAAELPLAIESLLRPRFNVWWDRKIRGGDYRAAIKTAIATAACVMPIWTRAAEESRVLHDELEFALRRRVPILPLSVHKGFVPFGFGSLQSIEIHDWTGSTSAEGPRIADAVESLIESTKSVKSRPKDLEEGLPVRLPVLFHSISSHETRLAPAEALRVLGLFGAKDVLVSAYDFVGKDSAPALRLVKGFSSKGGRIVLDSGNYEKFRRIDRNWTQRRYVEALKRTPHDLAFTYDDLEPPKTSRRAVTTAIKAFERDSRHTSSPVIPIVHLPQKRDNAEVADVAARIMLEVANETRPVALAIPERELGSGLFARTSTIRAVRAALNTLPYYQVVHVLGTGTPLTVGLMVAAGADSFDGLEWCRYVLDGESAQYHHLHHYDLFKWQGLVASSDVTNAAVRDPRVGFVAKAAFHNLEILTSWMTQLRGASLSDVRLVAMLSPMMESESRKKLACVLPELFGDNREG